MLLITHAITFQFAPELANSISLLGLLARKEHANVGHLSALSAWNSRPLAPAANTRHATILVLHNVQEEVRILSVLFIYVIPLTKLNGSGVGAPTSQLAVCGFRLIPTLESVMLALALVCLVKMLWKAATSTCSMTVTAASGDLAVRTRRCRVRSYSRGHIVAASPGIVSMRATLLLILSAAPVDVDTCLARIVAYVGSLTRRRNHARCVLLLMSARGPAFGDI